MTELVVGPAAVDDLRETRDHYEGVQAGLSRRFLVAVDALFERLGQFARSAPVVIGYADVRRVVVRGLPYVVFYRHQPGRIDVLRVLHAARSDADRPSAL
ncbi:MAG: type II toxin-antitoxin system RelE/ParE family toxin [Dehalococcoidia bacterium]